MSKEIILTQGKVALVDDDFRDFYDDEYCHRCDGSGMILICPDDMCRGLGECIHGDGEVVCPNCDNAFFI